MVTNHEQPYYGSDKFISLFRGWLEDILDQKQYVAQLQEELDVLREAVRDKKEELRAAEARLFTLLEEVGQQRLPFGGLLSSESAQNDSVSHEDTKVESSEEWSEE